MAAAESAGTSLQWSSQFRLVHGIHETKLQGDKIVLPPSALEQLISASTTIVNGHAPSAYDGFSTYPLERQQNLPQPLMFRLVNSESGNVAYCGVREFTAEEGDVEISPYLQGLLGFKDGEDADMSGTSTLTVHAKTLPKGTFVRFRPLEAGYDPEDWKALLEKNLRNAFTTLTKGQVVTIHAGKEDFQFLIDKITPDGDGICIVDTDLEVDIEPLDEEQARESLKRKLAKEKKAEGSSAGGILSVGRASSGHVAMDGAVDYTLNDWDRARPIEIVVESEDPYRIDVYVSPFGPRQRKNPRLDEHLFENILEQTPKSIHIRPTNVELEGAESIKISVVGYLGEEDGTGAEHAPVDFTITVNSAADASRKESSASEREEAPEPGDVRCKNCHQWVPGGRMFLHENFCLRNNVRCPKCDQVFQRSSPEWKGHWHCEHDDAFGNSQASRTKHERLSHDPASCRACGEEFPNMMAMARHRVTVCPDKEILCQFCHLLVPQKGPDDLDFTDPEVMLSGLTPHELTDGARTTECHMCGKIVRFRDMNTHLKHHDLERRSRPTPRLCRNANCGRTLDGVGPNGQIRAAAAPSRNDLGLCDSCFGPLYNSSYDPEHKALRRRVERRYLTQLVTGCGQPYCRNELCRNGRFGLGLMEPGQTIAMKEALGTAKPEVDAILKLAVPLHFCTDEASQRRRTVAEMLAAEPADDGAAKKAYSLPWCVAALEAESNELGKARAWLTNWAPTKDEERS